MSLLFKREGTGPGWFPNADDTNGPPGALLRSDNFIMEPSGVLACRSGVSKVYGPFTDLDVHSLFSTLISGTKYRYAGAGDKVYRNGVDVGVTFDGSGDISFGSAFGQTFMARGTVRKKDDGTKIRDWGIDPPSTKPQVSARDIVSASVATFNQADAEFTADEGTITGTYPDGANGQTNGSLELTPAATGRGTITKVFASTQNFFDVAGYTGSDTDLFDMYVWISAPHKAETLMVSFGLTDGSDKFKDDYFYFEWKIGGADSKAEREPITIKTVRTVQEQIYDTVSKVQAGSPEVATPAPEVDINLPSDEFPQLPDPGDVVDNIERDAEWRRERIDIKLDKAYNPGWTHFSVPRGQFKRIGATPNLNWKTVRGFRITYKNVTADTSAVRFDTAVIVGGGHRVLTGKFRFAYSQVRARKLTTGQQWHEKSPLSPPSDELELKAQGAYVTIPEAALRALDPQTDELWIYMTGGFLTNWYRVGVTGTTANDGTMALDEFARAADGTIAAADRARFNTCGFSTPGTETPFSPSDISGLKLWLRADNADIGWVDNDAVSYWPGSVTGYSSFTPTDIASLTGWFKADSGVYSDAGTTLAVDGDTVQQWNDNSGGARHLSQATGANKPIYKTGIVNGKPVVRFDGADDSMASTAAASAFFGASAKTAFFVYKASIVSSDSATYADNNALLSNRDTGVERFTVGLRSSGKAGAVHDDGTQDNVEQAVTHGSWALLTVLHDGTNLYVGNNNPHSTAVTSGASGASSGNSAVIKIGVNGQATTTPYFNGDLAEILLFNAYLNDEQLTKVQRYLANKYGLSMPTTNHGASSLTFGAAQYGSTSKPLYKASVASFNNKPAVYFDGSNDGMTLDGLFSSIVTNAAASVFLVAIVDANDAGVGAGSPDNNTFWSEVGPNAGLTVYGTTPTLQGYNFDGTYDYPAGRAISLDAPYILTWLHSGGNLYVGVNDTRTSSMNTVASGNTTTLNAVRIGAGSALSGNYPFTGWIAEVLVYNEALTEANRQKVESYLSQKYKITVPYSTTATFTPATTTSTDLRLTILKDETLALIENELAPVGAIRPPKNIIGVEGMHRDRMFLLTSEGLLWASLRKQPGLYNPFDSIRVADATTTPYWVKKAGDALYAGTSRDIYRISGDGAEMPDGSINLRREQLNVSNPPVDGFVAVQGDLIVYRGSDGYYMLSTGIPVPLPMNQLSMLYEGKARHGVSAVNSSGGRFRGALANKTLSIITPEGASTTSSSTLQRYDSKLNQWYRHTYTPAFRSIVAENDGVVLVGDTAGNVWQLDSGTDDNGSHISVTFRTLFEDGGAPHSQKDPFDVHVKLDTGGRSPTLSIHKNNSGTTAKDLTLTAATPLVLKHSVEDVAAFRNLQLRLVGEFTAGKLYEWGAYYRMRPTHRVYMDTGFIRTGQEDIVRYREIRICAQLGSNITVTPYFDDTAASAKTVTALSGVQVYRIPLGREYFGYQPRVVIEAATEGSGETGFEIYWIEFRESAHGNVGEKRPLRFVPNLVEGGIMREPRDTARG